MNRRGARRSVSYLMPDDDLDGISRFGRAVAAALSSHLEVRTLTDQSGIRSAHWLLSLAHYHCLGAAMNRSDVAHVEYRPPYFRGASRLDGRWWHFRRAVRVPLVMSAHDVLERDDDSYFEELVGGGLPGWKRWAKEPLVWGTPAASRATMAAYRQLVSADLFESVDAVVVHTGEQKRRLEKRGISVGRVHVLLHPLVLTPSSHDARESKRRLGVEGRFVITQLGYLHARKDYRCLIEALSMLPTEVTLLVAGGPLPGEDLAATELRDLARRFGVEDRLTYTGHLDNEAFDRAIRATDLGVASFRFMSASGTLAAWVANRIPVIASELDPVRELNSRVPGAIQTFPVGSAHGVRERVEAVMNWDQRQREANQTKLETLRSELSMERYAQGLDAIFHGLIGSGH